MSRTGRRWMLRGLWAGVPLLQILGIAGFAAAGHAEAGAVAIVFPPWWGDAEVLRAVQSQGLVPGLAGASFIAIVPPGASPGIIPGEWFRLTLPKDIYCL